MACAQVLAMNSTDWVARFTTAKDAAPENSLLAIEQYGKCYDARTDGLAAALGKQGQGPLIGARGNFRDFEAALRDFTTKALTDTQPPASSIKTAYASLYKKQFRYSFYQSYSEKLEKRPSSERSETAGAFANAPHTDAQSAAKPDTDPLTLAKNRFGEILAALAEDQRHEIHAAFGQIFERSSMGERWKLGIYHYAIFLLESPTDPPFSSPPF